MIREWAASKKGSIAVIAGIVLPVVVGFVGLGAEVSHWYFTQRKVQNAADAAAFAAAVQLRVGGSLAAMEEAGLDSSERTGFDRSVGTWTFASPPTSGDFIGPEAVEVVLTENRPRLFSALFAEGTVPFSGRAVARVGAASGACVLALDPEAADSITFTGNSDSEFVACDVVTNSVHPDAITVIGTGDIDVDCLAAVGGVTVSGSGQLLLNRCAAPVENSHRFDDPFAAIPEPWSWGHCEPKTVFDGPPGRTYDISPGRYCGGMAVKRNVNLAPGTYVIDGGTLSVESFGSLSGSGVTFYLANNADLHFAGTADIEISAPTSGTLAGLVVFAERDNHPDNTYEINGSSSSHVDGAIYAASGIVVVEGASTNNGGCTRVVSRMIRFAGGTGFGSDCTGTGVQDAAGLRTVELVE
jgi:hypothetical protein